MTDEEIKNYTKTDLEARKLQELMTDPVISGMLDRLEKEHLNKLIDANDINAAREHQATVRVIRSFRQTNSMTQMHANMARTKLEENKRSQRK